MLCVGVCVCVCVCVCVHVWEEDREGGKRKEEHMRQDKLYHPIIARGAK